MIGIGNAARRDDAAGLAVARRLRGIGSGGPEVAEVEDDPTRLLDLWTGRDRVIVVDAMAGIAPGEIRRWDAAAERLPADRFPCSTHGVGLAEIVDLARGLGELPSRLIVYGIAGLAFGWGRSRSPLVDRAVEVVAQRIREECEDS